MECIDIGSRDGGPQNYIFGYGSLIEDESRQRTTPTARDAWPVKVDGIRRGWWARGAASGLTTTYLGAIDDPTTWCNGVVYSVSAEELAATDRRESAGYRRCKIDPTQITMLDGRDAPPNGGYWAYINNIPAERLGENEPTAQFPMVQSYVDICVNGSLEVEGKYPTAAGFTQDFIASTHAWSRFWANDRVYPRRPFIYRPTASRIDAALRAAPATEELVWKVEIEPASWEDQKPVRPKVEASIEPVEPCKGAWECGG